MSLIKEHVSSTLILSVIALGATLSIFYGFKWGVKLTATIVFFILPYKLIYQLMNELKWSLIDKLDIDKNKVIFQLIISSVCLFGLFYLMGTYGFIALIVFSLSILLTFLVQIILDKFD